MLTAKEVIKELQQVHPDTPINIRRPSWDTASVEDRRAVKVTYRLDGEMVIE